ncbi:hypothetical protein SAY86_006866 [Trapa natans]|uniref:Uncharacterized protein n=1 Tax=Trapa natans TaxID=22666 RepID=A0AAN7KZM3_TRANT|nr:hypothetical protein SAY86_006866 [Trapa natans]
MAIYRRHYALSRALLRKVIMGSAVPNKTWKAIVEHANNCAVDDGKLYGYNQTPYNKLSLLFNSVYKVIGTADQKVLVQNMKKQALKNLHNLLPSKFILQLWDRAIIAWAGSLLQPLEFPILHQGIFHQGQLENALEFGYLLPSLSHNEAATENQSFISPVTSLSKVTHMCSMGVARFP